MSLYYLLLIVESVRNRKIKYSSEFHVVPIVVNLILSKILSRVEVCVRIVTVIGHPISLNEEYRGISYSEIF